MTDFRKLINLVSLYLTESEIVSADTKPVYAKHAPKHEDHYQERKEEMIQDGKPTIRVVDCGDYYVALEGCTRLAVAYDLKVVPNLVVYNHDDEIDITQFRWYNTEDWDQTEYNAGELADQFKTDDSVEYVFDFSHNSDSVDDFLESDIMSNNLKEDDTDFFARDMRQKLSHLDLNGQMDEIIEYMRNKKSIDLLKMSDTFNISVGTAKACNTARKEWRAANNNSNKPYDRAEKIDRYLKQKFIGPRK